MKAIQTLFSFVCLSACLLFAQSAVSQTITVATTEYSPFTSKDATHGGFVNRVIKEAFRRKGIDTSFKYLPWKRALEASKNCKFDALSFSFENPEREKDFVFSEPLSDHREVFFYIKSTNPPKWDTLSDLAGFSIGATRGYTYTEEFWAAAESKSLNIHVASTDEKNFKKLASKRIDLFPMDEITGWNLLTNELPVMKDSLATSEKALRSTSGHLIFARKCEAHATNVSTFNEGLQEMKNDGAYNRYLEALFAGEY